MFTDRGANRRLGPRRSGRRARLRLPPPRVRRPSSSSWCRLPLCERCARGCDWLGVPVSVDPATFAGVRDAGADAFFEWTGGTRLLFPNLDEGRLLTGEEAPDAILTSLLDYYAVVVVGSSARTAPSRRGDGRASGWRPRPPRS